MGKDYPHPIVQHEVISKKNIQRMKLAYAKRSANPAESPSKKQGIARNMYFYERLITFDVCHVDRKSYFNISLCFPTRCKAQGSICRRHAEEEREKKVMFVQINGSNRVLCNDC